MCCSAEVAARCPPQTGIISWFNLDFCPYWKITLHSKATISIKQISWKKLRSLAAHVLGRKASPLHGGVRFEDHEHLVAGGSDRMRNFAAAKPPEHLRVGGVAVVEDHMIVGALLGFKSLIRK